jgi:1,6-anhydro-N-acetylmuramate kinase
MTGTSLDGLDAALVEIEGTGLGMRARFLRGHSVELGELGMRLRHLAEQHPMRAYEIAAVMRDFAALHVRAGGALLGGEPCDLVCVHGQTVYHKPPLTWQLMDPFPLAHELGAPVVYDLRRADVAAGGQGAPITPIADWVLFRAPDHSRAVVNLGGFCNVTLLETEVERVGGSDVCSCNQLLDLVARKLLDSPRDEGGAAAARGHVHEEAHLDLQGILASQRLSRRSLGTGDELEDWVSRFRARVSPDDMAATACEGIAGEIAQAVMGVTEIVLAGGGVRNAALVRAIGSCCSARVRTTADLGVPPEYREAACFAVLGALSEDGVPITLPRVTGCAAPAPPAGARVRGRGRA